MSQFSEKFKAAVSRSGVSVADIAARTGISASLLYKYQSGTRTPDSLDTLLGFLQIMRTSEPEIREITAAYQMERLGMERCAMFQEFRLMLSDMANVAPLVRQPLRSWTVELPALIHGSANVNAAVNTLMDQGVQVPGGKIQLMASLRYRYGFECLSQSLAAAHPDFEGVEHLFFLKSSAVDEARLYNIRAIREVLPRMLTMHKYHPSYCYLPDPDDGIVPYPYYGIFPSGVLMLSSDFQSALFLADEAVREDFRRKFDEAATRFLPVFHGAARPLEDYIRLYASIADKHTGETLRPTVLAPQPSILPCVRPEAAMRYYPKELLESELLRKTVHGFFQQSAAGYTTFFTKNGLERLIETGELAELIGDEVPRLQREDVLDALEELISRSKTGNITPYLLKKDFFQDRVKFALGLYDTELVTSCQIADSEKIFTDITEATLAHVFRDYAESVMILGDVYSPEESLAVLERTVRRARNMK